MVVALKGLIHEHKELRVVFRDEDVVFVIIDSGTHEGALVNVGHLSLYINDGILGDGEVDLMALIALLGTEGFLGDGEDDCECGALVFLALESYVASMEKHQVTGEGKAKTCAYFVVVTVFTVVETLEEVLLLVLGDATSGIAYINIYIVVVTACLHFE